MPRKKRYLVQEVRPGEGNRIRNHPDDFIQRCCINGEEEKIVPVPPMADGGIIQNPEKIMYGERVNEQTVPRDVFDELLQREIQKEEDKKPVPAVNPQDVTDRLMAHLAGLDAAPGAAQVSFLTRLVPGDEAGTEYGIPITLRAKNRHTLADFIDIAIRAGQQDLIVGPVVFYLYAVQGHDRIKINENGLPYVELTYIFRLRETTPKQEV